jgi:hypothetical protein
MQDGALPTTFDAAKVAECRVSAAAMRNRAMATQDPAMRQTLVQIADEWDRLAAEIEKVLNAKPRPAAGR